MLGVVPKTHLEFFLVPILSPWRLSPPFPLSLLYAPHVVHMKGFGESPGWEAEIQQSWCWGKGEEEAAAGQDGEGRECRGYSISWLHTAHWQHHFWDTVESCFPKAGQAPKGVLFPIGKPQQDGLSAVPRGEATAVCVPVPLWSSHRSHSDEPGTGCSSCQPFPSFHPLLPSAPLAGGGSDGLFGICNQQKRAPDVCFPIPFCTGGTCREFTKGGKQSGITLALFLPCDELLLSSRHYG